MSKSKGGLKQANIDKGGANEYQDQDAAWYQYGGNAVAVGEDTLTQVETTCKIVDHGRVTTAKIKITATAVAEGDSHYTSTDTYIYSNSDISRIKIKEGSLHYDGVSYDTSTLKFHGICLPDHVNVPDKEKNKVVTIKHDGDPDLDFDLDGNVAIVTFDVEVLGDDTLANVDAYVLAIEDMLSESAIQVDAAVG